MKGQTKKTVMRRSKKAEKRVYKNFEAWEDTFNAITDLVSINDKDFRMIKVNRAFADTLGVETEKVIGKKCSVLNRRAVIDLIPAIREIREGRKYVSPDMEVGPESTSQHKRRKEE